MRGTVDHGRKRWGTNIWPPQLLMFPWQCEEVEEKMEREGETADLLSQRAALLRKMGR